MGRVESLNIEWEEEMRYRCVYPKCPAKFAAVVGKPDMIEPPRFEEKRLATYEIDEDGSTIELLSWEDTDEPVTCTYCHQPAHKVGEGEAT